MASSSSGNSSQNNDSTEKQSTPSKKRGITKMKIVTKMKDSGKKFSVQWNSKDQPIGENHARLSSYIGHCSRNRVAITYATWKHVPTELKIMIVEQVMQSFEIPNEKGKIQWIISTANNAWREFKGRLTREFLYKNGEICTDPPAAYEFIDESTWAVFIKHRQTDEFQKLSERNRQIALKNPYPYKAGRRGYSGIEQQIIEETNLEPSAEVNRGILWRQARVDIDGGLSGKVKEVADKMDEIDEQVVSGKLKLSGRKDSLSMALGKEEHPGRVIGAGKGVTIKSYFGPSKHRASSKECSTASPARVNALETQVQTLRKLVILLAKNQRIDLGSIEGIHDILLEVPSVEAIVPDKPSEKIRTEVEHVEMVNADVHSENVMAPTEGGNGEDNGVGDKSMSATNQSPGLADSQGKWDKCQLFWPNLKKLVATGTMFIPSSSTIEISLHCRPLPDDCMKVNIDTPLDPDSPLPFDMDEVSNVGMAIGIPIAWPKRLILPFKASKLPNKRKYSDVDKSKRITREVEANERPQIQSSSKFMKKMKMLLPGLDYEKYVASIPFSQSILGYDHSIMIWRSDIERWLEKEMIDASHVSVYMKYLFEHRCPKNLNMFGFLCPQRIAADSDLTKEEKARYICTSMVGEEHTRFKLLLAPYHNGGHWMLAAINPREDTVYWFDSLLGSVRVELKEVIEMAMTMYFAEINENKCRKNTRWLIVKGPRQPNNIDCGYYVLRNMREIIEQRTVLVLIEYFTRLSSPYTAFQIDEVREEWVQYVENQLIW